MTWTGAGSWKLWGKRAGVAGWRLHAFVLLSNHYHLTLETPEQLGPPIAIALLIAPCQLLHTDLVSLFSIYQLARTSLHNMIGQPPLDEVLRERRVASGDAAISQKTRIISSALYLPLRSVRMSGMSSPGDLDVDLDFGRTIRDLVTGQRLFDRYKLNEILGRGGMGVVWRAFDEQLERDVALKFLPEMVAFDEQAVADLKRETKKSQELRHHHIVQVYDFVSDKRSACISMEWVDGPTLSAIKARKEGGCLDVNEIKNWVEQLCEALAYAHHRARVVHRDLKPANLMINSKGELKVTDFGIARSVNDSVSMLTQGGRISGTLAYMSPQQLGGKPASHLDDIYSVGVSIYEILTSKPPFYTGDVSDQIKNVTPSSMQQRRRELELAGAPIPKEWEETVSACLAKDPNHRPQTAGEIAKRLGMAVPWYQTPNVVDGVRAKTAKVAGGERSTRSPKDRSKLIVAGVIMALLLVASAFAWFLAEQQRESQRKHAADAEAEKQRIATEQKIQARKDAEKLVADAQSLVKSGKLDQAETLARSALSKVPDLVDAKKVIADVAQARKSAADAKQQAEIQARKDAEKLVADAQSLVKSGKLDQAETLARSALSKVPDFVDAKKVIAEITEARKGQAKNVARVLAGKWECTAQKDKGGYLFVSTRILNFDDSGNRGRATDTYTMRSSQGKPWTEKYTYDFVLLEFNGKSGRYREFNCKLVSWPKEYPYAEWVKSKNVRDFLAGRFSPQFEFAGDTLTTDHGLRYHRVMKAAKN